MNSRVLLIDEEFIKQNSTISDNMDSAYITPSILDAQLSGLQPLIGTNLYDKLCSDVENHTLNGDYKILVDDYISMYLLYQVIANMTIDNFQRQHNAGSVQYTDTNYNQMYLNDVKYMEGHWQRKAEFYAQRVTDYLHANHSKFPEFCVCRNGADIHHNDKAAHFHSGLNLTITKKKKRKDR